MRYLKKPDAPDWDFHIATPLLEARGDMLPYTPASEVLLSVKYGGEMDIIEPSQGDLEESVTVVGEMEQPPVVKKPVVKKAGRPKSDGSRTTKIGKKKA